MNMNKIQKHKIILTYSVIKKKNISFKSSKYLISIFTLFIRQSISLTLDILIIKVQSKKALHQINNNPPMILLNNSNKFVL